MRWWRRTQSHSKNANSNHLTSLVIYSFHGKNLLFGQTEPVLDSIAHTAGMIVRPRRVGGFEHSMPVLFKCGAAQFTNPGDVIFDNGTD